MKRLSYFLIIILSFLTFINVNALNYPKTYSKNVIVYDNTSDELLYSKKKDEQKEIASLTKIMTTILAIEKIDDLKKEVKITYDMLETIPWDASIAGLEVGKSYTYEDLLHASILPSGADATQALAFSLSGSVENFVKEMNALAKKIGMTKTNYVNVTGYDVDNHYSSAADTLTLLKYALKNEVFKKIFETKAYTMNDGEKVESTLIGYSKYMKADLSKIKGSKTGFTDNAGLCIAATFDVEDHEIILITLGAKYVYGDFYHIKDAETISKFVSNNYHYQIVDKRLVKTLPVRMAQKDYYDIYSSEDVKIFLPDDYNKDEIKILYKGVEGLSYLDKGNISLGTLYYTFKDKVFKEEDVVLNEDMVISYKKVIKEYKEVIILGILTMVVILILVIINRYLKKRKRKLKLKNIKKLFK